ncbi:MAG: hypothetical protein HOA72_22425, partial [Desulfobacula sp.]|nr:hypothetical protein [Desulfobacula sp.]
MTIITSCSARDKKNFSETQWALQIDKTLAKDLYSTHYKDKKFFTPWMKMEDKGFLDVLKWKLSPKANYTNQEKTFLPRLIPNTAKRIKQTQGDFILWIGHNTFLIRID